MAKITEKEATFAESLALDDMFQVKGKPGIYMASAAPIKNNNWVRAGLLFNEGTKPHTMVKLSNIRWLESYAFPKMGKDDPKGGVPSEKYTITELIDNLYTWKKGKEFTPKGYGDSFFKNVCPKAPRDMVYESHCKKLVYFYNYFVSHINKLSK